MSRNNGYNNYGNSNSTQGDEKRVIGRTGYARVVPSSQQQQQQVYRTGYARTSPSPAPQAYSLGYLNVDVEPNPEYCQQQPAPVHHRTGYARPVPTPAPEPTIISGYEHLVYAHQSDRYQYLGKNEDGEPEWLDYGPKSGRR